MAGLDAGLVYNSWPKYADRWVPENLASRVPAWRNLFENEVTVQFMHRNLVRSFHAQFYFAIVDISGLFDSYLGYNYMACRTTPAFESARKRCAQHTSGARLRAGATRHYDARKHALHCVALTHCACVCRSIMCQFGSAQCIKTARWHCLQPFCGSPTRFVVCQNSIN